MIAFWDWFTSLDWSLFLPELLGKAAGFFLGFAVSWYLLFRRKLKEIQRFQEGDSDDVLFQMHKLVPLADGDVGLLFRNIGPRTTVNQLYDNPAARDIVTDLNKKTTLANPILATEGTGGFEVLNIAFGFIAGTLALTPFPRQTWLFAMTCEDRQAVRKQCVRCFLIQPEDLQCFADWTWCSTKVRVERPYHWFRIVALHRIALEWKREQETTAIADRQSSAMPLVDKQVQHPRVRKLSAGIYSDETLIDTPVKIEWSEHLKHLREMGMKLDLPE
ncbi:MAG: hypothetical protein WD768_00335 [Phycisphaeraceae bacterium]